MIQVDSLNRFIRGERILDDLAPFRSQLTPRPARRFWFGCYSSVLERVQNTSHRDHCESMIFNRVISKPRWVFEHGEPPLREYTFYGVSDLFRANIINQRFRVWTLHDNSILTDDMPLNVPIAAERCDIKLSFVNGRACCAIWVVAADKFLRNIGTLQLTSTL